MEKTPFRIAASILLMLMLGCGGGNGRQLQSITVSATGSAQIQLIATGTFNASPTSVIPLPVAWYVTGLGSDPPGGPVAYTLGSQPFSTQCGTFVRMVAVAPQSPSVPTTGAIPEQVWTDLVLNHTTTSEGGFIASPPQPIPCP